MKPYGLICPECNKDYGLCGGKPYPNRDICLYCMAAGYEFLSALQNKKLE